MIKPALMTSKTEFLTRSEPKMKAQEPKTVLVRQDSNLVVPRTVNSSPSRNKIPDHRRGILRRTSPRLSPRVASLCT